MYNVYRIEQDAKILIAVCRDALEAAEVYEQDKVEHNGTGYTFERGDEIVTAEHDTAASAV